jgi:hypothetical protein
MATYDYKLSRNISWFLVTNPAIAKINFKFKRYKVYPTAYRSDVAYALKGEKIQVRIKNLKAGLGAQYYYGLDELVVPPTFNLNNYRDQAYLIHECTHAHLDIQNIGAHLLQENEAVAYIAEAVFLEAIKQKPLGTRKLRTLSHEIARKIIGGTYEVSAGEADSLIKEIFKHPDYIKPAMVNSNGVWSIKSWFNPSK